MKEEKQKNPLPFLDGIATPEEQAALVLRAIQASNKEQRELVERYKKLTDEQK